MRSEPHPGAGLSICGAPGRSQCQKKALRANGAAFGCQLTLVRAHPIARTAEAAAREEELCCTQGVVAAAAGVSLADGKQRESLLSEGASCGRCRIPRGRYDGDDGTTTLLRGR